MNIRPTCARSTLRLVAATTYTQPAGVPHITYDTYFGEAGALQIDTEDRLHAACITASSLCPSGSRTNAA